MAKIKQTTVHHLTGMRFVGVTPGHQQVMIDGESHAPTGMNPMELLLNAVGACSAFDVVEMIRKRRVELLDYRVECVGQQTDDTPSYFTDIEVRHVINEPGLSQDMAEHLVDLALTKYCSVAASLRTDVRAVVVLEHER